MGDKWRLLDLGHLTAAENMALNRVILECRSEDLIPNTMRFLQFRPHCVNLGYHQSVELEVEEEYCRAHGLDISRRITGGGNLYWDESQLGWEIYALRNTPGIPRQLEALYQRICECGVAGLKRLGIEARFRPKNDIEVGGRKISGTGGSEFGHAFLYQGTLLTDFDVNTMLAALKLPVAKLDDKAINSFRSRVICLKEILGDNMPDISVIKKAMAEGFGEVLGITLEINGLTPEEEKRLANILPYFQSDEWIYGGREIQDNRLRVIDYKVTGGLIRVSVRVDEERELLKSVFITGDFFVYPPRAILDLEAALKSSSIDEDRIRSKVYALFDENSVRIPNMGAEDFVMAILTAVREEKGENAEV